VGLLILSQINRLNHITDRIRKLVEQVDGRGPGASAERAAQLLLLWRRARLIRLAIVLAATSALCAALLVAGLFLLTLYGLEDAWLIVGSLFMLAMATLVLSLLCFIIEINQSLGALGLELGRVGACPADGPEIPAAVSKPDR
jgi:hypothetical protein